MRTTVTFEGNLADDPQVRFTGSGKQITEITVLVNERRLNSAGEWVDGEPTRHVVKAFKTLDENIAESLRKGDRVFVHGIITTEAWTDQGDRGQADRAAGTGRDRRTEPALGNEPHDQDHPHPVVDSHRRRTLRRGRAGGLTKSARRLRLGRLGRPPC